MNFSGNVGNVSITRQEADYISEDGFEAIAGHDGLFIRQIASGTEIAFCDSYNATTVVSIQ